MGNQVFHQPAGAAFRDDDNPLPFVIGVGAAFHHNAGQFVAGPARRHGIVFLRLDRPVAVANIAAADGDPFQLDKALAVAGLGHFQFHEVKLLGGGQTGCFHSVHCSGKSRMGKLRAAQLPSRGRSVCIIKANLPLGKPSGLSNWQIPGIGLGNWGILRENPARQGRSLPSAARNGV